MDLAHPPEFYLYSGCSSEIACPDIFSLGASISLGEVNFCQPKFKYVNTQCGIEGAFTACFNYAAR